MNIIRIAVCDDLAEDRNILEQNLRYYLNGRGYEVSITQYMDGEPLACDYEEGEASYDLIFLDMFMYRLDGMSTARRIRKVDKSVSLVFLTTTPDYALEGYDVKAMGYLVKPLAGGKFELTLDRFLQGGLEDRRRQLFFKNGSQSHQIPIRDIVYMESGGRLLTVHVADGEVYRFYGKLDEVEGELPSELFLRCHKSFLANLYHIKRMEENEFIMADGASVPIRRHNGGKIRELYYKYLLKQAAVTKL